MVRPALIKKKIKFSPYISEGSGAKSYMTNDLLIYGENICAFPHILGSPSSNMTLHPIPSRIPYIWGKFCFLFYQCECKDIYWGKLRVFPALPPHFTPQQIPRWVLTTEYTLAYIPSWWKNQPWLKRVGGGGVHAHPLSLYLPSHTKLQCTLQLRGQILSSCFVSTLSALCGFDTCFQSLYSKKYMVYGTLCWRWL